VDDDVALSIALTPEGSAVGSYLAPQSFRKKKARG